MPLQTLHSQSTQEQLQLRCRSQKFTLHSRPMPLTEVQKYCALTGHIINDNNYIISKIVFDKLSPAQQEAITKATVEAAAFHTECFQKDEAALLESFRGYGVTITTPDKAPFRAACAPMYDEYAAKYGDAAIKAIEEAR